MKAHGDVICMVVEISGHFWVIVRGSGVAMMGW